MVGSLSLSGIHRALLRTGPRVVSGMLGFVAVSAMAGVLVAAAITPYVVVSSRAVSTASDTFQSLPESLDISVQPQRNTLVAYSGKRAVVIASVYSQNRQEITQADVTPVLKHAVLGAEDVRFYEHGGIDPQGVMRAAIGNLSSGSVRGGGSTLTQQLVKNLCLSDAYKAHPDAATDAKEFAAYTVAAKKCSATTISRKLKEMKLAIGLEKSYSKDEILLAYLNIANFGGTVYGIQSAAQRYYDVDATKLTAVQAASLVAIVQTPTSLRLDIPNNYAANTVRRNYVINAEYSQGWLTAAERDAALAVVEGSANDTLNVQNPRNGCAAANMYAKQFCDYVVKSVPDLVGLGATPQERTANWRLGGYTLYTTLDLRLQKVAQKAIAAYAPAHEPLFDLGASAVTVQAGTGRVLTMAQNKAFDDTGNGNKKTTTAVNFNTDKPYGGSSGFQVGSTYKVFTLINWLESGHGLDDYVQSNPRTVQQADFIDSCHDTGYWQGPYQVKNDAPVASRMSVRNATQNSVNGAFISMGLQLDLCATKKIAVSLGVHLAAGKADGSDVMSNPSSILGTNEIAPLTVAAAYAGVANDGKFCAPIAVTRIVNSAGKELAGQQPSCRQAIPKPIAVAVQSALGSAMARYVSNPHDGTPLIGKTGTTNDSNQTWVTGASTKAATTVWYGNIVGSFPIRHYGYATFGGNQRHLIERAILTKQDALYGGGTFAQPDPIYLRGHPVAVGTYTGMSADVANATIAAHRLLPDPKPEVIVSTAPAGQVVAQLPAAGTTAAQATAVRLTVSDGTGAVVPDVVKTRLSATKAVRLLHAAGFRSVTRQCSVMSTGDSATGAKAPFDGLVIASNPSGRSVVTRTSTITITVLHRQC
ncbi:hypothetical protein BH11ACT2_BH11ACT2_06140 [soil metagenome]